MKLTGICIITENFRKMEEFYSKVLQVEIICELGG